MKSVRFHFFFIETPDSATALYTCYLVMSNSGISSCDPEYSHSFFLIFEQGDDNDDDNNGDTVRMLCTPPVQLDYSSFLGATEC